MASSQPSSQEQLPGIRNVIAVASGKGGVGKSTVSVNLAYALQQIGGWIGLVDADIQGPSIPGMLGLPKGQPATVDGKLIPAERHNLKVMSMGMLTGDDNPAILRGPMVSKYLTLRQGFDVMVRKVAPEIVDIIDATDHAAGTQPFYPRTGDSYG